MPQVGRISRRDNLRSKQAASKAKSKVEKDEPAEIIPGLKMLEKLKAKKQLEKENAKNSMLNVTVSNTAKPKESKDNSAANFKINKGVENSRKSKRISKKDSSANSTPIKTVEEVTSTISEAGSDVSMTDLENGILKQRNNRSTSRMTKSQLESIDEMGAADKVKTERKSLRKSRQSKIETNFDNDRKEETMDVDKDSIEDKVKSKTGEDIIPGLIYTEEAIKRKSLQPKMESKSAVNKKRRSTKSMKKDEEIEEPIPVRISKKICQEKLTNEDKCSEASQENVALTNDQRRSTRLDKTEASPLIRLEKLTELKNKIENVNNSDFDLNNDNKMEIDSNTKKQKRRPTIVPPNIEVGEKIIPGLVLLNEVKKRKSLSKTLESGKVVTSNNDVKVKELESQVDDQSSKKAAPLFSFNRITETKASSLTEKNSPSDESIKIPGLKVLEESRDKKKETPTKPFSSGLKVFEKLSDKKKDRSTNPVLSGFKAFEELRDMKKDTPANPVLSGFKVFEESSDKRDTSKNPVLSGLKVFEKSSDKKKDTSTNPVLSGFKAFEELREMKKDTLANPVLSGFKVFEESSDKKRDTPTKPFSSGLKVFEEMRENQKEVSVNSLANEVTKTSSSVYSTVGSSPFYTNVCNRMNDKRIMQKMEASDLFSKSVEMKDISAVGNESTGPKKRKSLESTNDDENDYKRSRISHSSPFRSSQTSVPSILKSTPNSKTPLFNTPVHLKSSYMPEAFDSSSRGRQSVTFQNFVEVKEFEGNSFNTESDEADESVKPSVMNQLEETRKMIASRIKEDSQMPSWQVYDRYKDRGDISGIWREGSHSSAGALKNRNLNKSQLRQANQKIMSSFDRPEEVKDQIIDAEVSDDDYQDEIQEKEGGMGCRLM